MTTLHRILLALLAALLTRLALPGYGFSLLVWVAVAPLFLALSGARPRQRMLLGMIYGTVIWALAICWLPGAMVGWLGLPFAEGTVSTAAICLFHAVPYLIFGLVGGFGPESEGGRLLWDAALLTALLGLFPVIFPGHVALGLSQSPLFIQAADLGGMPLVLFGVLLVNRCGADLILRRGERLNLAPPLALLVAVMALVVGYGAVRLRQIHAGEAATGYDRTIGVVTVQPDVPTRPDGRYQAAALGAAMLATEGAMAKMPPADLVVWPEIPVDLGCDPASLERYGFVRHARAVNTPVLVNCIDYGAGDDDRQGSGEGDDAAPAYNAALLLDGSGRPMERYHKRLLFPFGEAVPCAREIPLLSRLAPATPAYRPGSEATVFDLGNGRRLAPLLCYEAIFPGAIRAAVNNGGTVLINMTDDAWFGDSDASELHLAFLPFRAVEFRTPLVRANNAGISAVIAATGEILPGTKTGLFQRTALRQELVIPGERTLYCRCGDLFLYGLIAVCGIDLVRRRYVGKGTIPCS